MNQNALGWYARTLQAFAALSNHVHSSGARAGLWAGVFTSPFLEISYLDRML